MLFAPVIAWCQDIWRCPLHDRDRLIGQIAQHLGIATRKPHLDRAAAAGTKHQPLGSEFTFRQVFGRECFQIRLDGRDPRQVLGADDQVTIGCVGRLGAIGQQEPCRPLADKGGNRQHIIALRKIGLQNAHVFGGFGDRCSLLHGVVGEEQRRVGIGEKLLFHLTKADIANRGNANQADKHEPTEAQGDTQQAQA